MPRRLAPDCTNRPGSISLETRYRIPPQQGARLRIRSSSAGSFRVQVPTLDYLVDRPDARTLPRLCGESLISSAFWNSPCTGSESTCPCKNLQDVRRGIPPTSIRDDERQLLIMIPCDVVAGGPIRHGAVTGKVLRIALLPRLLAASISKRAASGVRHCGRNATHRLHT
jgi:hypothetical protein